MNLIPACRIEAKARRAHLRLLTTALGAYALLILIAYVVCFASGDDSEDVFTRMSEAATKIKESDREARALRASINEVRRELTAARAVARHPDWSLLLALVAGTVADDVVLQRCVLIPIDSAPQRVEDADSEDAGSGDGGDAMAASLTRSYMLEVKGFARSQTNVSQFVLRLEKTRLFDRVRLLKTNRQDFLGGQAIAFDLECLLDGKGGPAKR